MLRNQNESSTKKANEITTRMKTTLETIAEKTGYSTSTVSRVLTGKSEKFRISESTKELSGKQLLNSDIPLTL